MALIDLHTHSSCSDGTLSPAELVDLALRIGLTALALTDHDTVEGLKEAQLRGAANGLEVITGVELSAQHQNRSMHILGYCFDPANHYLVQRLQDVQVARRERNKKMITRLQELGISIQFDEFELIGTGQLGRPHLARLLVAKKVVRSSQEGFERFLKAGRPAYAARKTLEAVDAISMIREAGGVAVLAHPTTIDPSLSLLPQLVKELKALGLAGIEAFYPNIPARTSRKLAGLARETGLLTSGGSDFHGEIKPTIPLAGPKSGMRVEYQLLDEIKKWAASNMQESVT